jgi:transcriptional regulator with XRE-family HTH domain
MTNEEFRAIRQRIGLTQALLAKVLHYELALTVSTYERAKNPRAIPTHVALLMRAYDEGYRPKDWPQIDSKNDATVSTLST